MPADHQPVIVEGDVTDLFGHRFVLATAVSKVLADLGPKGAEDLTLAVGDHVVLTGEQKPSEIKVHSVTRDGRTVAIRSAPGRNDPVDPAAAIDAVKAAGFELVGEPDRKSKHFDIVGVRNGERRAFHVAFDGEIRKSKPVAQLKAEMRR